MNKQEIIKCLEGALESVRNSHPDEMVQYSPEYLSRYMAGTVSGDLTIIDFDDRQINPLDFERSGMSGRLYFEIIKDNDDAEVRLIGIYLGEMPYLEPCLLTDEETGACLPEREQKACFLHQDREDDFARRSLLLEDGGEFSIPGVGRFVYSCGTLHQE